MTVHVKQTVLIVHPHVPMYIAQYLAHTLVPFPGLLERMKLYVWLHCRDHYREQLRKFQGAYVGVPK